MKSNRIISVGSFFIVLMSCYLIFRGYRTNSFGLFWGGTFLFAVSAVFLTYFTPLRSFSALLIITNTLILSVLAILGTECLYRFSHQSESHPRASFSYTEARENPEAFREWWNSYVKLWQSLKHKIEQPDPHGILPYVFIPSSSCKFMDATCSINSLGFRDVEFDLNKGSVYRIVALGESTTMGATILATDIPWPRVLNDIINDRLMCGRPIQVINAGSEGYTLKDNIHRLKQDILRLQPDMIISYHGYNGFGFLMDDFPIIRAQFPPVPRVRPSRLLSNVEFSLSLWLFRRRYGSVQGFSYSISPDDLAKAQYSQLYKELISIAKETNIRLILCSFNMAVDKQSPETAIKFYESGFPAVRNSIIVNHHHSLLVKQLCANEGVSFVDTGFLLNGSYVDKYIDLVHFTQEGRNQLAENIFAGIQSILHEEIAYCDPR